MDVKDQVEIGMIGKKKVNLAILLSYFQVLGGSVAESWWMCHNHKFIHQLYHLLFCGEIFPEAVSLNILKKILVQLKFRIWR